MSNSPGIAEEIRKALDAATPGKWTKVEFINGTMEVWQDLAYSPDGENHYVARIIGNNDTATSNAHLIANAPTWLRSLLEENERLSKDIDLRKQHIGLLLHELEQVKKERDELSKDNYTAWSLREHTGKLLREKEGECDSLRSQLAEKDKVQGRMMEEIEALREYIGRHAAGGSVDARQLLCKFTEVYPILSQYKESPNET